MVGGQRFRTPRCEASVPTTGRVESLHASERLLLPCSRNADAEGYRASCLEPLARAASTRSRNCRRTPETRPEEYRPQAHQPPNPGFDSLGTGRACAPGRQPRLAPEPMSDANSREKSATNPVHAALGRIRGQVYGGPSTGETRAVRSPPGQLPRERSAVLDHPNPESFVWHRIRLELQPQVVMGRIEADATVMNDRDEVEHHLPVCEVRS